MGILALSTTVRRGFTLAEVLVVILVVAALVSLSLPLLSQSRQTAKNTKALAGVRSMTIATFAYSEDFRGYLPYVAQPLMPWRGVWIDGKAINAMYFSQSYFGSHVLTQGYLAENPFPYRGSGFPSRWLEDGFDVSMALLTATAASSPEYWVGEVPPTSTTYFVGQKVSTCAFPSRKVLFTNSDRSSYAVARGASSWLYGAFDGAADIRAAEQPEQWMVARPMGALFLFGVSTRDGLRGVDW